MKNELARKIILSILSIPLTLFGIIFFAPILWVVTEESFISLFRLFNLTFRILSDDYDHLAQFGDEEDDLKEEQCSQ